VLATLLVIQVLSLISYQNICVTLASLNIETRNPEHSFRNIIRTLQSESQKSGFQLKLYLEKMPFF